MPYINEEQGIYAEDVTCPVCGWKGTEDDLEIDYYDSHTNANAIATCCPVCRNICDE